MGEEQVVFKMISENGSKVSRQTSQCDKVQPLTSLPSSSTGDAATGRHQTKQKVRNTLAAWGVCMRSAACMR